MSSDSLAFYSLVDCANLYKCIAILTNNFVIIGFDLQSRMYQLVCDIVWGYKFIQQSNNNDIIYDIVYIIININLNVII